MSADESTVASMAREELESAFDGLILAVWRGTEKEKAEKSGQGTLLVIIYLPNSFISLPPFVPSPQPTPRLLWAGSDPLLTNFSVTCQRI